jgi:septum formation protein
MEHMAFVASADRCTSLALDFSHAEIAPTSIRRDLILDRKPTQSNLVLASSSPRRVALLEQAGYCFTQITPRIDEAINGQESPDDYVIRLSKEKARNVFQSKRIKNGSIVLSADTTVVLDGNILGKPESKLHAGKMLSALSGRQHQVLTGVTICNGTDDKSFVVETSVEFRAISTDEIDRYWETGEPADKAGGYGIQGMGAGFVKAINGSYSNVVGLPLMETISTLKSFGIGWLAPETEFRLIQDSQDG